MAGLTRAVPVRLVGRCEGGREVCGGAGPGRAGPGAQLQDLHTVLRLSIVLLVNCAARLGHGILPPTHRHLQLLRSELPTGGAGTGAAGSAGDGTDERQQHARGEEAGRWGRGSRLGVRPRDPGGQGDVLAQHLHQPRSAKCDTL